MLQCFIFIVVRINEPSCHNFALPDVLHNTCEGRYLQDDMIRISSVSSTLDTYTTKLVEVISILKNSPGIDYYDDILQSCLSQVKTT
jgi:hypothetical protein